MIDYKIMGVPKRNENIIKLKEQLNINDNNIFIDFEYRKNPMWSWKQTALLNNTNDSHICIIQDDAMLPNKFKEFCKYLISRFPKEIWMFYYTRKFDLLPNRCIFSINPFCGGVVSIIPKEYISNIIDFQETNYPTCIHDDLLLKYWSYKNNIKILSTKPLIVDTLDNISELGHSYKQNNQFCNNPMELKWANGTNVNLSQKIDWGRLEPLPYEKGTVCVKGINATRIGNIMFQCAVAKTYAKKNNLTFKGFVPTNKQLKKLSPSVLKYLEEHIGILKNESGCEKVFEGFLQDETLIDKDIAIDMFKIPLEVSNFIKDNYGDLSNYVSVNIRRGDYLKEKHKSLYNVYSEEELNSIMEKHFPNEKFIFTSDDIDWCKDHFEGTFVNVPCEFKELVDLYVPTLCKGNIISCSSFSWWGAYLNQNSPKVVTHWPWYKTQEECDKMNIDNLIPNNWIKEI